MERNEDRYQEETVEVPEQAEEQAVQSDEGVNDMTFFIELLKHLRSLVEQANKIPLTKWITVDQKDILSIVDDLDRNLPDAVQYGMQMYSEQDRIMGQAEQDAIDMVTSAEMRANKVLEQARRDAEKIKHDAEQDATNMLNDAEERAAHMVSEDEIVRRARDEARTIRNDARVEAGETRLKANHDAYRLLSGVESKLEDTMKEIHRLRNESAKEEQ